VASLGRVRTEEHRSGFYKPYHQARAQEMGWWNAQDHIPSMRQMAFDHISIPAMSAETERVFSDTKLLISDLRSRLEPEIIEALECIRKWILAGL